MKKVFFPFLLLFALSSSNAQEITVGDSLRKNAIKIFIDCSYCDMNHIRREIPYVNYVRDIKDAQLYLRETRRNTGSGGREYSYLFIGQKKFAGINDTLIYTTRPDDTSEHRRQGRTNMMKMGLMRYVARTPIHKEVSIKHTGVIVEEEVSDKWNNWVFEIETRPRFESKNRLKNSQWTIRLLPTK